MQDPSASEHRCCCMSRRLSHCHAAALFPGLPCPDQLHTFVPAGTSAQESPFALLQLKLAVSFKVTFPERPSARKDPQHLFNLRAAVMSTPAQKTGHSQVLLSLVSYTTEKSPRAENVPA